MKYSIIIPTMWFHVKQLREMLTVYNSMNSVGEIIIIDNDSTKTPKLNFDKLKIIGSGVNMYVNPSWKFGIENAEYDNVILVNDDITLKGNINALFENAWYLLRDNVVIGPSEKCYTDINFKLKFVKVPLKANMNYGFGVFMFMKKSTFLNTYIPDDILVWHGDRILHLVNKAWCFEGVNIITGMSGTTSKLDLTGFSKKEKVSYMQYVRKLNADEIN